MNETECSVCEKNSILLKEAGDGPWQGEPNRVEWEHAGLPCIAHRGPVGSWCGYVGLSPGHPLHGKTYNTVHEMLPHLSVHGGLTYSETCSGCICHVPKPGEPDDLWWLGFDCAHAWDYCPRTASLGYAPRYDEHYWTLAEVQEETNRLAEQLVALG